MESLRGTPHEQADLPNVEFKEIPEHLIEFRRFELRASEELIGHIELVYYPRLRLMEIGSVSILKAMRGKGFGKAVYVKAGSLNEYDGQRYSFVSSNQLSDYAIRVWESLVKDGLARKTGDSQYVMIDQGKEVSPN